MASVPSGDDTAPEPPSAEPALLVLLTDTYAQAIRKLEKDGLLKLPEGERFNPFMAREAPPDYPVLTDVVTEEYAMTAEQSKHIPHALAALATMRKQLEHDLLERVRAFEVAAGLKISRIDVVDQIAFEGEIRGTKQTMVVRVAVEL